MEKNSETLEKLTEQGSLILQGHSDIELVNEEVNQIWELDAADLSKSLRAVIIQQLRNNRQLFVQNKKAKAAKKLKKAVPDIGIDLDDLDLSL